MSELTQARTDSRPGSWALGTATIAALLASSCCLAPLVLVSLGLSGAWLSNLRVLQTYSAIFTGIAAGALLLAGRALFRGAGSCSVAGYNRRYHKTLFCIAALTLILLVTPLIAPWFY
jgi:mercuric ion transport protein